MLFLVEFLLFCFSIFSTRFCRHEKNGHSMEFQSRRSPDHHLIVNKMHNELITMRQYLFAVVCFVIFGISVVILTTIWKISRKHFIGRVNNSEIFYTKDEEGLCNAIENSKYEVISFNK